MLRAAVLGSPVAHSLSPAIHGYWMARHGVAGAYGTADTAGDGLTATVRRLLAEKYTGFNVTAPHKQTVMALCDVTDDTAKAIGAVNTVAVRGGETYGTNTDAQGFIAGLRDVDPDLRCLRGRALVMGAGGAARAVVHALRAAGTREVIVCNRTEARARSLSRAFLPWERRTEALADAALVVNTTVLGMAGQKELDLPVAELPRTALVCDIVYRPRETALLRAAAAHGCRTVDGTGMLLHQAAKAFEIWTGVVPDVTEELRTMIAERAQS